ncbi:MAG: hypothetical protein CMB80_25430 [Flammeovirgaceae bacterium]|nr:hypothetical protein [Flammeovirgaceae bacterium]MBE63830.1 hypothetical protein [Flammeovirgaceae bacterium]HCX23224.1 hypothetical protein [Cytophagales bacterium]|tara:strand:- start:8789 stop:10579 length:1791 start_codon:yes stop_codon:yes gene_type:complete
MDKLTAYLLEVGLSSGILFLGYLLIRQRLQPKVRRFVLLACLIAPIAASIANYSVKTSVWLPTSTRVTNLFEDNNPAKEPSKTTEPIAAEVEPLTIHIQPNHTDSIEETSKQVEDASSEVNYPFILYVLIASFLILKLFVSLFSLRKLITTSEWDDELNVYLLDKPGFTGASFLSFILISRNLKGSAEYASVLAHEQSHVKKKHTLDILLSEVITALFWYNPIFWIIKSQIKINNEYEVDQEITSAIGLKNYANLLVALSTRHLSTGMAVLNNFSYHNTKRRIQQMQNPVKQRSRSLIYMIPFVLLAFWTASCDVESNSISEVPYTGQPIKAITTTFVSHQNDTENKDMKTVAVANFLPDGSLDQVIQHMTYPYNYEKPVKVSLWGQTNANSVPVILDGLSLDIAENNFLYGNDWPAEYANSFDNGHPKFSVGYEGTEYTKNVKLSNDYLPESIVVDASYEGYNSGITLKSSFIEEFKYSGNKVETYHHHGVEDNSEINKFLGPRQTPLPEKSIHNSKDYSFSYSGDLLTQASDGKTSYEFEYDGSRLVASKYLLNGKVYNTRKYYYTDSGLKERTEIFNVYGDAEYSIHYNYEFY